MLYYQLVCLVTYINCGVRLTALDLELEDPSSYEKSDTIPSRRVLRGWDGKTRLSTKPIRDLETIPKTRRVNLLPFIDNPYYGKFDDHWWPSQWYMHDQRTVLGPVMDHNVVPVYEAGYTGKDVAVGVIGDGVKHGMVDLPNVMEWFKPDINSFSFQEDPDVDNEGKMSAEGTMMAGVIAMKENNRVCGVGVAYDAKIVGIKIFSSKYAHPYDFNKLSEAITYKKQEGTAMSLCDIYAFAIGRPDDGKFMEIQTAEVEEAFKKGISTGRKGLGSIYVVGAGNGKDSYSGQDNCGADDLVNDPAAIGIASADHRGKITYYSESCAAVMATAYSSSDGQSMVTTTVDGFCTGEYLGNNPSVGIAAGIFALTLQAKPELTARDVQHLVAMTSEVAPLVENLNTWKKNKAGFFFSNDFGFGLLNAENMVIEAKQWINVPQELKFEEMFNFLKRRLAVGEIYDGFALHKSKIQHVETVEIICNVKLEYRGSININLTSPLFTEVVMLEERPRDRDPSGLSNWRLKTAHFWGEDPRGDWHLSVSVAPFPDQSMCGLGLLIRHLKQVFGSPNKIDWVKLVIHGTEEMPARYHPRISSIWPVRRRYYSAFHSAELHGRDEYQEG